MDLMTYALCKGNSGGGSSANYSIENVGKVVFSIGGDFSQYTVTENTTEITLTLNGEDPLPAFDFYSVASISTGAYSTHMNFVGFEAKPDLSEVKITVSKSSSYQSDILYGSNINFYLYKLKSS